MMSSSGVNLEKYFIPLDEITRATENFSHERRIGGGGFGAVYKAELPERWHNSTVAIKRLDDNSHQGETEFRNELKVISKFQHVNIIAFVGYCDEEGEMIIVYEYALNGSLDQHLQDPSKMRCITWKQRLKICIGVARGLRYLHSGLGEENRVIHRDVKSANILLDGNMVAKICDFGLSKLGTKIQPDTQVNTKVAGTQFYLDPTYHESGILRRESDVYSFGVVLFEILSGMLVYGQRRIGDELQSLMNTVRRYHKTEPYNVIDPCIQHHIKVLSFDRFKEIAYQCISFSLTDRPTLDTVIDKLEEALRNQLSERFTNNIPADRSVIEVVIDKLNSASRDKVKTAFRAIKFLTKHCDENRAAIGQAGAIPRLTHLLKGPDYLTQQRALIALSRLSVDERNIRIIIDSGAVPVFVRILEKGSNEERERVAIAIYNLSFLEYASETIGSAGAIPPLMLLLSEGTTPEKKNAADALDNLCDFITNTRRAITAGLVPVSIELLTQPQGELKEVSLALLATLSSHPQGSVAIGDAGAVPHLVEIIGNGSPRCDEYAVAALEQLSDTDQKYLVEAKKHGVMEKLKLAQTRGTETGMRKAKALQRRIKRHQRCTII